MSEPSVPEPLLSPASPPASSAAMPGAQASMPMYDSGDRAAMLRLFLAGRDEACPACEYNLRDLQMPRCPECGLDLELRLALSEPKQAAFVAGLVVIAAGLGFNLFLLAYFVFMMLVRRNFGPRIWDIWPVVPGTLTSLAMLAAWLWARRRLRRMSALARWSLVLGAALMTLVWVGCFFATVR